MRTINVIIIIIIIIIKLQARIAFFFPLSAKNDVLKIFGVSDDSKYNGDMS